MNKKSDDFEAECRQRFAAYCAAYKVAAFHSLKRTYVNRAYDVIDDYLAWREIQSL